ncbi:hypothetical protein PIIN_11172 [Serendipita indica DSM 11827]|uniref:Uncharacterized protein n=1 Tax=Serendipita indica (strain DSM 11827) TaxID=1109443 RepID=G4U0U7_SERID|nr:hypothetical protein PIIN_11172 [Serendipita indica DSM 11827]
MSPMKQQMVTITYLDGLTSAFISISCDEDVGNGADNSGNATTNG